MKLFTVGPVEMYPATLAISGRQLPYFRTEEFSSVVKECDETMRALSGAPEGSRTIMLTASGTGAMEAAVVNCVGPDDQVLVIDGGSFGARFCEICKDNGIAFDSIKLQPGKSLDVSELRSRDLSRYKALLINAHETSTGLLYDLKDVGELCRSHGTLFIVDAISAFLCDPIDMRSMNIDVLITSSQKALALAPGLSMLVLAPRAVEIVSAARVRSHYFGLAKYIADGQRGQTPFTPAVGVILQLQDRLRALSAMGLNRQIADVEALARHFRSGLSGLPYAIFPERSSNALTALTPKNGMSAYSVYSALKTDYGLVVTPNGGHLADKVFRVGHMGNVTRNDLDELTLALKEIVR